MHINIKFVMCKRHCLFESEIHSSMSNVIPITIIIIIGKKVLVPKVYSWFPEIKIICHNCLPVNIIQFVIWFTRWIVNFHFHPIWAGKAVKKIICFHLIWKQLRYFFSFLFAYSVCFLDWITSHFSYVPEHFWKIKKVERLFFFYDTLIFI